MQFAIAERRYKSFPNKSVYRAHVSSLHKKYISLKVQEADYGDRAT
jgi:hypothetical protein